MISETDIRSYAENGFLVVQNVLSAQEVAALRAVTDEFIARSREVSSHDAVYDLEPGHSAAEPRVRRIKTPHLQHEVYDGIARHPRILEILRKLVSPAIRFDTSKLNVKAANYGAAVEWHQDWAFYPHTNDDLAAVGVMMDDCEVENGPLLCIPGSHRGPVLDHHSDGEFCGAIDPSESDIDFGAAVPLTGPAGSVSIHHVRTIHGSATNVSSKPRRLLLFQYRAADAWPLVGSQQPSWQEWQALMLCGDDPSVTPRSTAVPVRLPLPPSRHQGSIYENQRTLKNAYFTRSKAAV
ncbi:phytanoyl-CoA dioxygenase family protein (plasmid) [Skermanella rosea]|uniref:phytanoyl-CoA dioxygenase family protein n=1 Tax=Skermanella rosea TaxID=1817965 RepID=UPI001931ACBF|nr:phytanoyl-CoA dioxygenase family protein [Skermanella rosea]UEM07520.1 phytanoyl-CoA dioxygenase family protein [Skermanella rosea]